MDTDETFRGAKGGPTGHVNTIFVMPGSQEPEIWDFKDAFIIGSGLPENDLGVTLARPGRPVGHRSFFWERDFGVTQLKGTPL